MSENYLKLDFAKDEKEARERFEEFSSKDPLTDIPPALLNSADIYDYARITGMVFPFDKNNDNKKLKSASYEIDFLGDVYQINEKDKAVEKETIECEKPYTLKKNSIVFLFIETKFFLPDYIAIRFNLKITHVHRGLLLGTGPLVDPGFAGRLLIPLHNLTSEDYVIKGGNGLIWVEFTKISPNKKWRDDWPDRENGAKYVSFPPDKRFLSAQQYFNKASPTGKPANSSIPGEIQSARIDSQDAKEKVSEFYRKVRNWTLGGTMALIIGVAALIFQALDLITNAYQNISIARDVIDNVRKDQIKSDKKIESLEAEIRSLTESLELANKEKSVSTNKNNGSRSN